MLQGVVNAWISAAFFRWLERPAAKLVFMNQDFQDTSVCPGSCGESQGFGTCDDSTGKCTCSMGWSGPDCNDATCCPLWVVVGIGTLAVLGIGSCILWRFFSCMNLGKVLKMKQDEKAARSSKLSSGDEKSRSSAKLSIKSTSANPIQETGTTSAKEKLKGRSSTLPNLESGLNGSSQPTQDAKAGAETRSTQPRRSAPDPIRGRPSTTPGGLQRSKTQDEGTLRNSAWSAAPLSPAPPEPTPKMRRSRTDAFGGHASRAPADEPATMGHSQTAGATTGGSGTAPAASGGSSGSSGSLPFSPQHEDDTSPHVKEVQQKMRDMMDRPLLVRKKTLKDLLVEHHPDKNSDVHATEVFQAVNNARSWFLHEPDAASK